MSKQETLIQTETARVRIMQLLPGEATPLHHHTEVTDNIFGLNGAIVIRLTTPDETVELFPGARYEIPPGRKHEVRNADPAQAASYLLVQGGGHYDFIDEPDRHKKTL